MSLRLPAWMTETGPLPILERPTQQPRDAAGRFASYAELPPPPPRRRDEEYAVRRGLSWAEMLAYDSPVVAVCCAGCVHGGRS